MDIVIALSPFTGTLEVDINDPTLVLPLFKGLRGGPGPAGPSAYDVWAALPGNEGKTEEEFTQAIGSAPTWAEAQW